MSDILKLDYYYGIEADQFSFYRVPRLLIKDERFKDLSSDAKLLYGLMLDRLSMSVKNGWFDKENRAYIYYTLDNIMDDLGCAREKASKVLAEIDSKKGIGLIEKKRQGLGKPDIIYVKNFATIENAVSDNNDMPANAEKYTEVRKSNFKKFDNEDSRSSGTQEVRKSNYRDEEKQTSRSSEIELQEVRFTDSNYNEDIQSNNNYTEENHINQINPTGEIVCEAERSIRVYQNKDRMDKMDEAQAYIDLIKKNIDYDFYMNPANGRHDRDIFNEVFEVMVDIVVGKRDTVVIGGAEYPHEVVKSRFLKIDGFTVEYVIDKVTNNLGEIRNIRNYLITALYNAPTTHSTYYAQLVNHDMYGSGRNWSEEM